ncbi:MAG: flagellar type III secretion system pore protein FliP [Azospirillum sp.]|nr:flagellar type III secretion system pore protein FliP [Azospirillum sp.]
MIRNAVMRRRTIGGMAALLVLGLVLGLAAAVAGPAAAQSVTLDLGGTGGSTTGRIVQLIGLTTVLTLAPSILIMMTSFTRIVIVLSFLRTALGLQQSPPNTVMISLALFLTFFIMTPVFQKSYTDGIQPLINEEIDEIEAFRRAVAPFHSFMLAHTAKHELELFIEIGKVPPLSDPSALPLQVLIPAFMISEIKRAFEMGFLIFLPFLIIDMVVASILMSMGMMMLPPTLIAIPFKVIYFVLVDGWYLIAGSLVKSYTTGAP